MSTTGRPGAWEPRFKEGLNSRYRSGEHAKLLNEATAEQEWEDRINKHHEHIEYENDNLHEIATIKTGDQPRGRGIVIDDQHIWNLEDME